MQPRRVFLGWDGPALPAAARWLRDEHGDALGSLVLALPGGRALRRLGELLARAAAPGWSPPRIVTQGALVDELVHLERPAAGRLARTLAWRSALASLPPHELDQLARGASRRTDGESRLRLAETIRTLHGELAPEGLEFADLAGTERGPLFDGGDEVERARWKLLAKIQDAWRAELERAGVVDPHEGRRAAIEADRVDATRDVVLIGIADMNELLAALLRRLERATVLVAAPQEHEAGFDELGRIRPAYWSEQHVPFDDATWFVEEKPADQADRALDLVAGWSSDLAAEAITIGVADDEVVPYLERRLRGAGARLRVAAGTPLARTRPYRLLRATADFVERRGFSDLAALARHPDAAARIEGERDPAEVLDTYYKEHLPRTVGDEWHGEERRSRDVSALAQSLVGLLGELGRSERRDLAAWAQPVRAFLGRVYAQGALDPEREDERVLAGALRSIGAALDELGELPPTLAGDAVPAGEALRLLLRTLRAEAVPPAAARADQSTVEALGWLELALDDAPALVVTGFNEGRVPQSVQGDAFLPDALRVRLGLADNRARLARDVFATSVLCATRARVAFITGRRAQSGDPLVPSRIAFQAPREEIVARVRRFLPPGARTEPADDREDTAHTLQRRLVAPRVERMSVTAFRTYLESPYLFYLKHVLGLRTLDDRARELDPMVFGIFAHDVLETLATGPVRDSSSAADVGAFLLDEAERRARERFGADPLPAITIQLEQLKYRLRRVARVEAQRRAEGWRILRAEWKPKGAVLDVDGLPMPLGGKVDRIDAHVDGRWAVLDYKTGERAVSPDAAARRKGVWVDLQLPLYRLLVEPLAVEHGLRGAPELGYFLVGRDEDEIGVRIADQWTEDDHEQAIECARDVVRAVRRGDFFDIGQARAYDPIFEALIGKQLLQSAAVDEEGEADA